MGSVNITVYCASSNHIDGSYLDVAEEMGRLLAERSLTLVYGGGDVGLMGVMARTVHRLGGKVVGVIPRSLQAIEGRAYEIADELLVTETVRERKKIMFERADAYVALAGGIGTLEEFLEVITLRKLGYHDRPVALVNTRGFYDGLLEFFGTMETERFLDSTSPPLFETVTNCSEIFERQAFRELIPGGTSSAVLNRT